MLSLRSETIECEQLKRHIVTRHKTYVYFHAWTQDRFSLKSKLKFPVYKRLSIFLRDQPHHLEQQPLPPSVKDTSGRLHKRRL